jgi:hypothetical protein
VPYAKNNSEKFKGHKVSNPPEQYIWEENNITVIAESFDFPTLVSHRVKMASHDRKLETWASTVNKNFKQFEDAREWLDLARPICQLIDISDEELSQYFQIWRDSTLRKLKLNVKALGKIIQDCDHHEVWTAYYLLKNLENDYLRWQKYLSKSIKASETKFKARHLRDLIHHLQSLSISDKDIKKILAELLKVFAFPSPTKSARNILDSTKIKA